MARGMLVLTRRVGEGVTIGDSLVKVLGVSGRKVRLGVQAPPELRVSRCVPEDLPPEQPHPDPAPV